MNNDIETASGDSPLLMRAGVLLTFVATSALLLISVVQASPASLMPQRNLQADLAEAIATCEPFGEIFTNPYTGDTLWRNIEGRVDNRCRYVEDLPGNQRMTCNYAFGRLPGLADLYANPERYEDLTASSRSKLVDGKMMTVTTYSRNGEPVAHPLEGVFENGECVITKLPADAASRIPAGTVFGDPYGDAPAGFKAHELPFKVPDSDVARPDDRSEQFYAVVLKRAAPCTILEDERAELQTYLQQNRVFMTRFGCDDEFGSDEFVTYEGLDPGQAFLAIYGGIRREHAEWLTTWPMLQGRYGEQNLRIVPMRAVLVYP